MPHVKPPPPSPSPPQPAASVTTQTAANSWRPYGEAAARARHFRHFHQAKWAQKKAKFSDAHPAMIAAFTCDSLLFIHVLKSGGTSMASALQQQCMSPPVCIARTEWDCPSSKYYRPLSLLQRFLVNRTVFATVRDPVQRFRSAFDELTKRSNWSWPAKKTVPGQGHGNRYWDGDFESFLHSVETRSFWNAHLWPQAVLLRSPGGEAALPLDLIFGTERIDLLIMEWIPRRLHANIPNHSIRLRGPQPGGGGPGDRSDTEVAMTPEQEVRICRLYALDYVALGLWPPSAACDAVVKKEWWSSRK
mmetsp:Transcript_7411/g.16564  ORF Transcript_7411/g.16564 Transcript_7411/m.16564 type:complete len:304 (-) Transcript_7411:437-1348(-)